MKMPEKHDPLAAILRRAMNKASGQSLCCMAYSRYIMMVRLQNSNRRNDVRHYRLFIRDLRDFADYSNLAYITSVFIGYIGTDSIGSLNKRFAAKKAGVEDGRNQ